MIIKKKTSKPFHHLRGPDIEDSDRNSNAMPNRDREGNAIKRCSRGQVFNSNVMISFIGFEI